MTDKQDIVKRLRIMEKFLMHAGLIADEAACATAISEIERLRDALEEAIATYGKPGGPWNVPSDPGGWLSRARAALKGGSA